MDMNVIKEYLVKVGFTVDANDFNKFHASIKSVEELMTKHTAGVQKKFVEAGGAIVSAYAAIGTAAVTLMNKVATADMGYQLYAMRMYMSVDAAKKLKIATDALGHSLDEIAWNPELRERLKELYRVQNIMTGGLGPDFKNSMKGIRDFQAEWQKLKVEMGYISQSLASVIFKAFGGDGDLLTKVKGWTEWIANHIPEIRDKIAKYLIPILENAWGIFKNIGVAIREVVYALGELTGDLFGGKKMAGITNQYEKFGVAMLNISGAIKKATDNLIFFIQWTAVLLAIKAGMTFGAAVGSVFGPVGTGVGAVIGGFAAGATAYHYVKDLGKDPIKLKLDEELLGSKEAWYKKGDLLSIKDAREDIQEIKAMRQQQDLSIPKDPVKDMIKDFFSTRDAKIDIQEIWDKISEFMLPKNVKDAGVAGVHLQKAGFSIPSSEDIQRLEDSLQGIWYKVSKFMSPKDADAAERQFRNIPQGTVRAVMHQESKGQVDARPRDPKTGRLLSSAYGPMQLLKGTAKDLGVDRFDPMQNLAGGARYLSQMLTKFNGNLRRSLIAYHAGPGGGTPKVSQEYADKILRYMAMDRHRPQTSSSTRYGDVHATINVHGGKDSADTIAKSVTRKIAELRKKTISRQIAQSGNPWSDAVGAY